MNTNIINNIKQFLHIKQAIQPENYKLEPLTQQESQDSQSKGCNKLNKSIIINTENGYVVLVMPSHYRVNYRLLNKIVSQRSEKLNNIYEVQEIFPDYIYSPDKQSFNMSEFPVYIYFVNYSADEMENISDAGSFLDLIVTSYKH